MASDSNNPASNDQATERIPANPLSDARRAELTEARIVEIAEELEKAKQAALASDLEALVLRRRCQDLEKKLEKMPHLVNGFRIWSCSVHPLFCTLCVKTAETSSSRFVTLTDILMKKARSV